MGGGGSGGLSDGINDNIVLEEDATAGLGWLDNHGGLTRTIALLNGSQAIDAGDDDTTSDYDLAFDQRGNDRYVDGDGDTVVAVDIDAFELAADEYFDGV